MRQQPCFLGQITWSSFRVRRPVELSYPVYGSVLITSIVETLHCNVAFDGGIDRIDTVQRVAVFHAIAYGHDPGSQLSRPHEATGSHPRGSRAMQS
jgi:hypothetical protein